MRTKVRLATTLVALLPLTVVAGGIGRDSAALSLSMEHFRDSTTVATEAASGKSLLSTEEGYVEKNGLRTLWNDEFLTGVVDDRTGLTQIHVEARVRYSGQWHEYHNATFLTTDGEHSARVIVLDKTEKMCSPGDCLYSAHLSFALDEPVLRQIAADYVLGKATMWGNKLMATDGSAISGGISNAEIAGFLAKADIVAKRVAATTIVPQTASLPAVATTGIRPSGNVNFGLDGIFLAATPEMPIRAGLLIIAVTRGSIAQRAGVIAGDVLFEFDQAPIRSLDDLHTAIKTTPGGARAMLKLFRGTEITVIAVQF